MTVGEVDTLAIDSSEGALEAQPQKVLQPGPAQTRKHPLRDVMTGAVDEVR